QAQTDVVPVVGAFEEDTGSLVQPPDAAQLVAQLLELAASEAAALLAADSVEPLAELHLRSALARWDVQHQRDEALRVLELAERADPEAGALGSVTRGQHPLAARLRATAALEDCVLLERISATASGALGIEVAEAWLWRHGRADLVGEIADRL